MMPISGVNTSAVQPLTTAEKVLGASKVQKPEEEDQGRQLKPVMDEYVPEEPQEPSGRYWMDKDEAGRSRIFFDDRSQMENAPDAETPEQADGGAQSPEKSSEKGERWSCSTDQVDREIEKLKKQRQELEQRLNTETDEAKIKELERQLAQVEQELKQKDSDAYRKRHAVFTRLS